ncbi:MAG: DUF4912 domain-containing protein [Myxococcaceae bacterium]
MDDLKTLTVKYLRELARKHLGKGHSKLKTKEELLDAVKEFIPSALKSEPPTAAAPKEAAPNRDAPKSDAPRMPVAPVADAPVAEAAVTPVVKEREQHDAEPLIEGFFVARVAGEEEARRHHMTDQANRHAVETKSPRIYDENLGDLPTGYEDDTAVALPKDPSTVFFYWDFHPETRDRAFAGLSEPKALLRIYDGDALIREIDFSFESRSFYVNGLTPGRRYRLEAHAVGRDGQSRRVGPSSNVVAVPWEGPSADTRVRYLRAPWSLAVGRMMEHIRIGEAQVRESHGPRHYLDIEEWEELANSASNAGRRVRERWEGDERPGPGPGPRRRHLGASEQHPQGGPSGWPSGRK